jgi:putative transposase
MKTEKEAFDYEALKQKALEQFRSGKSLYGKDGAFAPLLKDFFESALEAELEAHLNKEQRKNGNRRNGQSIISPILDILKSRVFY